ncbi:MAG: FecR domain-containing protein [Siphonobacter aquaeclarae]|nr:FecR domain-containing protein [Siphonobacter aquaeclarae]
MQSYNHFKVEDFLNDPSFRRWVFGRSSEEESADWETYVYSRPPSLKALERARGVLAGMAPAAVLTDEYVLEKSEQILAYTVPRRRLAFSRGLAASVGGFLLIAGLAWWGFGRTYLTAPGPPAPAVSYQALKKEVGKELKEVVNASEKPRVVLLPDGSSVLLQANSRISFPTRFEKEKREVFLSGEGFFEVKKDRSQPFYVYANEVVARVLGTSFTVRAFDHDTQVQVLVKTGSVSVYQREETVEQETVEPSATTPMLVLSPSQKAVFQRQDFKLTLSEVKAPELQPIEQETFIYLRTPISAVFRAMEKTYGVRIEFDADVTKNCTLTATLGDKPLTDKLDMICAAIESSYVYENGSVMIKSKGCQHLNP